MFILICVLVDYSNIAKLNFVVVMLFAVMNKIMAHPLGVNIVNNNERLESLKLSIDNASQMLDVNCNPVVNQLLLP